MGIVNEICNRTDLTEREERIWQILMEHPEHMISMSAKSLGEASYSSAAAVSRFCRKVGCRNYGEFRVRFLNDIQRIEEMPGAMQSRIRIMQRENAATVLNKISKVNSLAIEETKNHLTLDQLARVGRMFHEAQYIDFYAMDMNAHLANYACNEFIHCGKIAQTYVDGNMQQVMAMQKHTDHLAILISHTAANRDLLEIAALLRHNQMKMLLITNQPEGEMAEYADEVLFAGRENDELIMVEDLWTITFSAGTKYLLDLLFGMEFSAGYESNITLSRLYHDIGCAKYEKNWKCTRKHNRDNRNDK